MRSRVREDMTQEFIKSLKENVIPWEQEWVSGERAFNPVSKTKYKGTNAFWLAYKAHQNQWKDPRWCTFDQAKNNGWKIKPGSRGTKIEFFSPYDRQEKRKITYKELSKLQETLTPEEIEARISYPVANYVVFNAEQIEGIPDYTANIPEWDKEDVIAARDNLFKNMNLDFNEGGDRAYYSPSMDSITLPEIEKFTSEYGYMATMLHEAGHATGHTSRLNRDMSGHFGSESYAREELRAEIASAFTAQEIGISNDGMEHTNNHKAYVQDWISVLQNDPNELFRAIKQAEEISDYLMEKGEFEQIKLQSLEKQKESEAVEKYESEILPEGWTWILSKEDGSGFLSSPDNERYFEFNSPTKEILNLYGEYEYLNGSIPEKTVREHYEKILASYLSEHEQQIENIPDDVTVLFGEDRRNFSPVETAKVAISENIFMDGTLFNEWYQRAKQAEQKWFSDHTTSTVEFARKIYDAVKNSKQEFEFEHDIFHVSEAIEAGNIVLQNKKVKEQEIQKDNINMDNPKKLEMPLNPWFPIKSRSISEMLGDDMKRYVNQHKQMLEQMNLERIPVVINGYGGPGAGKSTACMNICAALKIAGYNAEYVQEYAKDLVYEQNFEMLDGSPQHQFEILKEQTRRLDRLYYKVEFIVTDSPVLLNTVYNNALTPEYAEAIGELYKQYTNFSFFMGRDVSHFQEEGRIHNLEQSIQKDNEIRELLAQNDIYYGEYRHDTVDKIIQNAIHTYERLNSGDIKIEDLENQYFKIQVEDKSLQLQFEGKPTKDVRTMLKDNKFRWDPEKAVWHHYMNDYTKINVKSMLKQMDNLKEQGKEIIEKNQERKTFEDQRTYDHNQLERDLFLHEKAQNEQAIRDEVKNTLQSFIDNDMNVYGKITEDTLEAIEVQGYEIKEEQLVKKTEPVTEYQRDTENCLLTGSQSARFRMAMKGMESSFNAFINDERIPKQLKQDSMAVGKMVKGYLDAGMEIKDIVSNKTKVIDESAEIGYPEYTKNLICTLYSSTRADYQEMKKVPDLWNQESMVSISAKLAERLVNEQISVITNDEGVLEEIHNPKEFMQHNEKEFYTNREQLDRALEQYQDILPIVQCEWSEAYGFDDGKFYTLKEYDDLMRAVDTEFVKGREAARAKYETEENFENTNDPEDRKYVGYRKNKFTVDFGEGHEVTERQDIGDGEGGIIEHFENISSLRYHCEIMREAVKTEEEFNEFQSKVKEVFAYEEENNIPEEFRTTSENMEVISREMVSKQYELISNKADNIQMTNDNPVMEYLKKNIQRKAPMRSQGMEL